MKYITFDENIDGTGDVLTHEFDFEDGAIESARRQWNHLTLKEQAQRTVYVLESANPNEDAADHFDGTVICKYGG